MELYISSFIEKVFTLNIPCLKSEKPRKPLKIQENQVFSSKPPLYFGGLFTGQVGRALEWHSRGQRFEPAYLHHNLSKNPLLKRVFDVSGTIFRRFLDIFPTWI